MEVWIVLLFLACILYFVILIGWVILSAIWESIRETYFPKKESRDNRKRYTH